MKIMFLCGSLEPGRDGVGDYIRRLAVELSMQGYTVAAAALYDNHITNVVEGFEEIESTRFWVLRLPTTLGNRLRFRNIAGWIKKNSPDCISLQYVGFGFHRYGLPWNLILLLKKAIGNIKLHVMLHELWCGMPVEAGGKEKLLGAIQRKFLPFVLRILKPDDISTSNRFYAAELKRIHVKANVLPIFGNIPLDDFGNDSDWEELISTAGLSTLIFAPGNWLVLGFFGAIYRCPGLNELLQSASKAATQTSKRLGLLAFGNNGEKDIASIAEQLPGAAYWQTGILPAAMINRVVGLVNVGVITTPANRVNKSGTAAALLERGVPVLVSPQDDTYNKKTMQHQGVYQINEPLDVLDAVAAKGHLPAAGRLVQVAKFYSGLGQVAPAVI